MNFKIDKISLFFFLLFVLIINSNSFVYAEESGSDFKIDYFGIDDKGDLFKEPKITITKNVIYNVKPLLNYIFFEENSSEISERYILMDEKEAVEFREEDLYYTTLLFSYYQILNIVGSRMQKYPDSKLTIKGYNSNEREEKNNSTLSRKRAEAIKNYLVKIWKLADARLKIESGNLPDDPSKSDTDSFKAQDENMRAELFSDNENILSSINSTNVITTSEPTRVRFVPKFTKNVKLSFWEFNAQNYRKYESNTSPHIDEAFLPEYIDWNLDINNDILPKHEGNIEVNMQLAELEDTTKKYFSTVEFIPVMIIKDDKIKFETKHNKEVAQFNLIVFPFNGADISDRQQKTIEWIKSKNIIKPNSKVSITGYTDYIGNITYNKNLSDSRANNAYKSLRRIMSNPDNILKVEGKGEVNLLGVDSPESRFYNRTVQITIETEVKK